MTRTHLSNRVYHGVLLALFFGLQRAALGKDDLVHANHTFDAQ